MNSLNNNKQTRRKIILTSASTVVLLSAIAPVVPVFASENNSESLSPNNFSDVYISNEHADAIRTLAIKGIAKGYPDYTFAPYQALTMSDALKFLGRYVEHNGHQFSLTFLDNPHLIEENDLLDHEIVKYANIMNRFALTNVTAQELIKRPELSREQTASMLVHFVNQLKLMDAGEYAEKNLDTMTLGDLDQANYEHQDAIKTLAYLNITPDDVFKPKEVTTRGEFASFLVNAIENVLENPDFKDDLYADYLFDDVHVAQDGSKIFGSGALPKSTILVKELNNNIIGSTFVEDDSAYELELIPNLTDGARIAIEMTDHVNNKISFEKVVRVAATDFSEKLHVHNVMDADADLQNEEMQFDFIMGGNMASATVNILEETIKEVNGLNPKNYTTTSWAKVHQAITSAQQTLLNWEASEDMLNKAFNELEQAISHLEVTESSQTLQYAMTTLDVLVMKLLEVQKDGFTEESYEQLQNTILRAIVTTPEELSMIFNELVTAASSLQLDYASQKQQYETTFEDASDDVEGHVGQTAQSILQKALEAIVFTVKQYSSDKMVSSSKEQLNQSIQFAEEALKQNATTHELTFALTNMIGTLTDIQLVKQTNAADELLLILNAQIQSWTSLEEADYSEDSWQYLENTIMQAKQVLNSDNVDEIRTTIESIQYAIYQLKTVFYEQSMAAQDVASDQSYEVQKLSTTAEKGIVDQTYSIMDLNEIELYELKVEIQTLLNNITYVVVSEDGKDTFNNALWTNVEARQLLDISVKAARHAMYQDGLTVDELQVVKTMLKDATEAYDLLKKNGLVKSTTTLTKELEQKVIAADMLLKQTQSDENGEYVSVETYWATQAMHDQLNKITRQSVVASSNTDAKTVRAQLKTLEAAVNGFLSQRKIGQMAMTYSPDALNMEMDLNSGVASMTFDDKGALDFKKIAVKSQPASNISLNDL